MSSPTSFGSGVFGSSALGTQPFYDVASMIDAILYTTGHGDPSNETTKRQAILRLINNCYQKVCMGTHWRWLQAAYDFNLEAPYDTGTVSLTIGSAVATGSGTVWAVNQIAAKDVLLLGSINQVYHVSNRDSSTQVTLETDFAYSDDLTDADYVIARNQYVLPSATDHLKSFVVDSTFAMVPLGVIDFRKLQATDPCRVDTPRYYSLVRRDTDDDSVYIEVWPNPDRAYQCHIDYTVRIAWLEDSEDCFPVIPDRYRAVLFYGARAEFFQYLRDPSNAQLDKVEYNSFLAQMKNDTQLTDDRFVIQPQKNYRARMPQVGRFRGTTTIEDFGRED